MKEKKTKMTCLEPQDIGALGLSYAAGLENIDRHMAIFN